MIRYHLNFRRVFVSLAVVSVLAGCSSGVKLEEPPVPNTTSTNVSMTGPGESSVASVNAGQSSGTESGPVGVARVVYFDFDSYVIKPEFQSVIDAHARYLKDTSGNMLMIEGHTDDRGGREYNLALGQRRAEAVRRSLGLLGVPDSRMEAVSFGKEKPAVQGYTEEAHAQNRRAELSYRR